MDDRQSLPVVAVGVETVYIMYYVCYIYGCKDTVDAPK